jgi:hypothetical protein
MRRIEVSCSLSRRARHDVVALLTLALLLASCPACAPLPKPVDFPFHETAAPFEIHWRLTPGPSIARADGLIERRHRHIGSAWIQLVGRDATDSIVSFTAPGRVRWRSYSDSEFFTIALRPRGTEQRFEVRLYSFEYQEEMSP